jgi:iduronate 2-sulfatase
MKHTLTILTALLLTALLRAPLAALHAADSRRQKPNVLFIISDDLKPLLGCYGTSWIQSPNIDRLAAKGTVFMANYCQVAFCAPVCISIRISHRTCSAPASRRW